MVMSTPNHDAVKKNYVTINKDGVVKVFSQGPAQSHRFKREVNALKRLTGIEGIPALLSYSPTHRRIVIARIPGAPLSVTDNVPDKAFIQLRTIVEDMLDCGVARHSLPARDVIVAQGGAVGLVDFERCSLRHCRFGPLWWIARKVARFNLLRLIDSYAPHLLTQAEHRTLRGQYHLQSLFHCVKYRHRRAS
ncbi:hypothetical protein RE432_10025 [Pusillimonas sp. SM2304]|uniref:hypothetical protein n=1 Tax=Pusillimonas sp. SM2304 TaxID=3073241 RepID=UPI0028742D5F|nr:hypothetical protein [Pusillimonas sp. SM2304]MDS1140774.1 hypothetical protein [Pusillimonas sp. SM2304]